MKKRTEHDILTQNLKISNFFSQQCCKDGEVYNYLDFKYDCQKEHGGNVELNLYSMYHHKYTCLYCLMIQII